MGGRNACGIAFLLAMAGTLGLSVAAAADARADGLNQTGVFRTGDGFAIVYAGPAWVLVGAAAFLLVGAGLVGAAVARTLLWRPRAPLCEAWSVDEAARSASDAAADEAWAEALLWTRRARDLAPTSLTLLMDEAFFLEELGREREALARYEEAAARSPDDGEADFHAANLLLRLGAPPQEAVLRFVRCLEKSPEFVHDVEDATADACGPLLADPDLRRALRAARHAAARQRRA